MERTDRLLWRVLSGAVAVVVVIAIGVQVIGMALWIWPLLALLLLGSHGRRLFSSWVTRFGLGGMLTLLWVSVLLRMSDHLPRAVQEVMVFHLAEGPGGPCGGRADACQMTGPEWLGIIVLVCGMGVALTAVRALAIVASPVEPEARRVWVFRILVAMLVGAAVGVPFVVGAKGYVVFGVVVWWTGVGVFLERTDPRRLMRELDDDSARGDPEG